MREITGERIKQERLRRKELNKEWTQGFVANLLGITRTAYGHYESGGNIPPAEILLKLSEIFNVSVDYLLGKTEFRNVTELELSNIELEARMLLEKLDSLPDSKRKEITQTILGYVDVKIAEMALANKKK